VERAQLPLDAGTQRFCGAITTTGGRESRRASSSRALVLPAVTAEK